MRTAIFADIHGKILLPFKLVDYYQKVTGNKIDLILQCGDVGAYPYIDRLDKATIKHAMDNRDELGFYDDFTRVNPKIKDYLNKLNVDMVCVRGNHEDHDYLDEQEKEFSKHSIYPVDAYGRVFMFKSGMVETFGTEANCLSVIGVGRIGGHKGRNEKRFIQDYERKQIKKLMNNVCKADILITHDKSEESGRGFGMPEIQDVLDNVFIPYHFHGHTGEDYSVQHNDNKITSVVKIKELEFRNGVLPKHCMVILEKNGEDITFETVGSEITNMFSQYHWKDIEI